MLSYSLVIHGGAGTILPELLTPELENKYKSALHAALDAGEIALKAGMSALDAVELAVRSLEDEPLFNAGRGAVFAHDGSQEMDASVMDGKTGKAGAVSAIQKVRNPISLARAVMEKSEHVYLTGAGAMQFARELQIPTETDEYFYTEQRYQQLLEARAAGTSSLDHNITVKENKFGTVGAVAFDNNGFLAAATSTGGMTNKRWGRVGDSPIIGAGTYANQETCAISCTGHGEYFIRGVVAYDIHCLMLYKHFTLEEAMEEVAFKKLLPAGGEGGMIGVDNKGNTAMVFNSAGMYRGCISNSGNRTVGIYG